LKDTSSSEGALVVLARYPEPWRADLVVSLLGSEGIEAFLADEHINRMARHVPWIGGVGVVVREGDAQLALEILERAENGQLTADHGEPDDPLTSHLAGENADLPRCPRCGSAHLAGKKGIKALFSPGYRCRVCGNEFTS
jgi:hypothetical protein